MAHTGTTGFIVGLLRAAVDGLSIYACPTKLLRDAMYRKCGSQAKVVVGQSLAGGDCLAEVAEELLRQQNPEKARAVEWFERCLEDPDRRDCCEQVVILRREVSDNIDRWQKKEGQRGKK